MAAVSPWQRSCEGGLFPRLIRGTSLEHVEAMAARVELVAQLPLAIARWAGAAAARLGVFMTALLTRLRQPTVSRMSDDWLLNHERNSHDQEQ